MVTSLPELQTLLAKVVSPIACGTEAVVVGTKTVPHLCLCIRVEPSDVGKVIGPKGHTIEAIRTFVVAASAPLGEKARVCVGVIGSE